MLNRALMHIPFVAAFMQARAQRAELRKVFGFDFTLRGLRRQPSSARQMRGKIAKVCTIRVADDASDNDGSGRTSIYESFMVLPDGRCFELQRSRSQADIEGGAEWLSRLLGTPWEDAIHGSPVLRYAGDGSAPALDAGRPAAQVERPTVRRTWLPPGKWRLYAGGLIAVCGLASWLFGGSWLPPGSSEEAVVFLPLLSAFLSLGIASALAWSSHTRKVDRTLSKRLFGEAIDLDDLVTDPSKVDLLRGKVDQVTIAPFSDGVAMAQMYEVYVAYEGELIPMAVDGDIEHLERQAMWLASALGVNVMDVSSGAPVEREVVPAQSARLRREGPIESRPVSSVVEGLERQ